MNNIQKDLDLFLKITEQLLTEEIADPVVKPIPISKVLDQIDLKLYDKPAIDKDFTEQLTKLVLSTPRTASKLFFNQLFGGRQSRAVLGELLAVILNNSMYTYKVGGPMIVMEKQITRKLSDMVGFGVEAEGTTAPGGSMTNLMGMIMARDWKDESSRHEGVTKKMTVYTSTASHYSIHKNAAFAGIGRDQVRKITTDDHDRIDVTALEAMITKDIADGYTPTMINATAGTTVIGAFDPLRKMGELAQKYKMWFHVDGAYCGSVLFSKKYKYLLDGSELADSFTINAHKMLGTTLASSFIMVKDKKHLYNSFSQEASYLYQTADDDYNPGKISMQCGRRNDTLKFWTLWKSLGTEGVEAAVDHQFDLARHAKEYIKSNPDYTLVNDDDTVAVCFNYKGIDPKLICNKLYEHGEIMVGYGKFRDLEFIRLVTINFGNTTEDLDRFFKVMEKFVADHF